MIMRFTALLPPPPTPITSIRADWLNWIPEASMDVGTISIVEAEPLCCGCIMSLKTGMFLVRLHSSLNHGFATFGQGFLPAGL